MSITLYIAEKPSMAKDLAKALGARTKKGICWQKDQIWVSYCIGHLMEIANPDAHDPKWKRWHPSTLPILPRPIQWQAKSKTKSHLKQLISLMKNRQVKEIVNACDAGREGELIFRSIYQHSGVNKPVKRFWVSSLTQSAIKKGIQQLQASHHFDPLAAAAYCRAEADWLVGMNATRALTARSNELLSIGRVQTPTLAMIVKRHEEIQQFVPQDYWTLEAELITQQGQKWKARWRGDQQESKGNKQESAYRINQLAQANQIADQCRGKIGVISKALSKNESQVPPQLYHLTALQQEGNRRFSYSATQVLSIAQSLYEKHKLITYPRTDSRYLTPDLIPQIPSMLNALPAHLSSYAQHIQQQGLSKLGGRYVNAKKVGDHHAILPSTKSCNWNHLNQDEQRIYDLIARSLLVALSPVAIDAVMTIEAVIESHTWVAKGKAEVQAGWREIAAPPLKKKTDHILPYIPVNTATMAESIEVQAKQTQPPKPYNEANLLGAMEHAGNQLDREDFKKVLKGSGLGTPATRANILDTLLRRKYIQRKGKVLSPTLTGETLIAALHTEDLKSPILTAQWEQVLHGIANAECSAHEFQQKIYQWVAQLTQDLLQGPRVQVPNAQRVAAKISKTTHQSNQSIHQGGQVSTGSWRTQSALKKDQGKTFKKKMPQSILESTCPHCKKGTLIKGQRGWGCKRWKEGCHFVIWFDFQGVYVPEDEAIRVAHRGQSRLFHEQDGQKWRLCYHPKKKDLLYWESNQSASYQKKKARKPRKKKKPKANDKPWQKFSK